MDLHHLLLAGLPAHSGLPRQANNFRADRYFAANFGHAHQISSSAKSQVARINAQNESPARHLCSSATVVCPPSTYYLEETRNEQIAHPCPASPVGRRRYGHPAPAANVTETELIQAATALAQQYDANYAAKNPAGMAALYAPDAALVAPAGSIVRGRQALTTYYASRFASGAPGHAIKVVEAHVQGNGGVGLYPITPPVPGAEGNLLR